MSLCFLGQDETSCSGGSRNLKEKKKKGWDFMVFSTYDAVSFLPDDVARLSHGSVGWSQFNVHFMHLAAASQGRHCMFQQSLDVLLKSHQAIKSNFEAANEAEMSSNITRVNWAIITSLVSYSLLMTNWKRTKRRENCSCFCTADNNDHHMGCYDHHRLVVFFSWDSLLGFITD